MASERTEELYRLLLMETNLENKYGFICEKRSRKDIFTRMA